MNSGVTLEFSDLWLCDEYGIEPEDPLIFFFQASQINKNVICAPPEHPLH